MKGPASKPLHDTPRVAPVAPVKDNWARGSVGGGVSEQGTPASTHFGDVRRNTSRHHRHSLMRQ